MSGEYYLKIISLDNCPYSQATKELVKNFSIPNEIINITSNEKEKYKTNKINTFPQIYLKKYGRVDDLLLGGYEDLKDFMDQFHKQTYSTDKVNNFMNKYNKTWPKKSVLRLIQLINS